MPGLICLREKLWTRTYSIGDQVPTCPVFTRAKIKSHFGILVNLPSHYFTLWRVFHTSISWGFSTGVWVTVRLLKSPGLSLLFWPFSTMLLFGWSPLVLLFPNLPVSLPILWGLFQVHQLQLLPSSFTCSIVFSIL